MYQYIDFKIKNYIAQITINRPPVNALNQELVLELGQVASDIEKHIKAQKVRAVLITSTGKIFCAGADLKERLAMSENQVGPVVQNIGSAVSKLANISVPTIAALQGSAFGGGFEVALAADMRVMAEGIQVGLRETALAIIPGAGATQRLTRLIGLSNAMLWITTARLFTAEEALRQGAANRVVPADQLISTANDLASEIAANGPVAVRQAKHAILSGIDKPLAEGLDFEFECYKKTIPTKDRLEGLEAFKEKRPPNYRGE